MPKVTILLPIFNAENYIDSCLSSLLDQTFDDFEIIAINDGSTDGTFEVLERVAEKDKRLRVINQNNQGLIRTLNKGLELAKGEYIARIDSDDIALSNRIKIQTNYLDENKKCLLCSSDYIVFNDKTAKSKRIKTRQNSYFHKAEMIFGPSVAHPTVMFRSEEFSKLNLKYDPKYKDAEDYELWTRVNNYGDIRTIPEPLMKMRQHETSITAVAESKANNVERASIIGEIHKNYLNSLNVSLSEDDLICHYMLSDRMRFLSNSQKNLKDICDYAYKLINKLPLKQISFEEEFLRSIKIRVTKILYTIVMEKPTDLHNFKHCIKLFK